MDNLFKKLCEGGGFSLPYLLHIWDDNEHIYLINDTQDKMYNSNLYKASTFGYKPSDTGDASLEVALPENANHLIDVMENNRQFNTEIVGIMLENGDVTPIRSYQHKYGRAEWTGKSAKITFPADDRMSMTFPALIFNTYNNRGNS